MPGFDRLGFGDRIGFGGSQSNPPIELKFFDGVTVDPDPKAVFILLENGDFLLLEA